MKLKYLVKCKDRVLFANSLDDLACYYKVTLSGMRYKINHELIDLEKINYKLQNLNVKYEIDNNGVVTVMINDFIRDKNVDS